MDAQQIQKLHYILPHFMGCECNFEDEDGKISTGVVTLSLLSEFKVPALRQKGKKSIVRIMPYVRSFFNLTFDHIIDLIAISTNFEEFPNEWKLQQELDSLGVVQSQTLTHLTSNNILSKEIVFKVNINFDISIKVIEIDLSTKIINTTNQAVGNQIEITLYLITNYFDIFGLRKAGLAKEILNKTKEIQKIKQGI